MVAATTRRRLKTLGLAAAAGLLFAPYIGPSDSLVTDGGLVVASVALTWWLVFGGSPEPAAQRDRFANTARFYVLTFLMFWIGIRVLGSGRATISPLVRLSFLGMLGVAGYWLWYQGAYRSLLSRLRDAWIKDLPEEERAELESLRGEGDNDQR